MPYSLAVALVSGLIGLTCAILALIGVMVKTAADVKLGKRGSDITLAGVGVQQQNVDVVRIEKLVKETVDLRLEIQQLWDANRQIRHDFEMSEVQHEAEKKPLHQHCEVLEARCTAQEQTITQQQQHIERAEAERDLALAAQERAEGGLASAQKTIASLCPSIS